MNNTKIIAEDRPANSSQQRLVRSDTSRGGWATFYTIDSEGNAHLWERKSRYEPRALARSRAFAALGIRREGA